MIGSLKKGVKMVGDGIQISSATLPEPYHLLRDELYIPVLNIYLIATKTRFFRKDISVKALYPLMDVQCSYQGGTYLDTQIFVRSSSWRRTGRISL